MGKDTNLLIIGAGQYGHVVKEIAELMGCYEKIDFVDDNSDESIGRISDLDELSNMYSNVIVAIGNANIRKSIMAELHQYNIISVIHSRAVISKNCVIGRGCVVEAGAVINTDAQLEEGVLVSAGAVVNHNSKVGSCSHIDCNSVVESGCIVPSALKIHSGTVFTKNMSKGYEAD